MSIVRTHALLRLACNRDESRQRAQAHPPFITVLAGRQVLTPQDPTGGGTWIAANGAGIVFALMNVHEGPSTRPAGSLSRGGIIPMVADSQSLHEVARRVGDIPRDTFAPCRLLAADGDHLIQVTIASGRRHRVEAHALGRALLFTSSSLGDALVDGPRRLLFEQMVAGADGLDARQDAYHAHRWRDRPALSVHMSRPDACTVSTTVVETTAREVRMTYTPAHCDAGTPVGLIINREHVRHDTPRWARSEFAAV